MKSKKFTWQKAVPGGALYRIVIRDAKTKEIVHEGVTKYYIGKYTWQETPTDPGPQYGMEYEWSPIAFNSVGESPNPPVFWFSTENEIKPDAPVFTIGNNIADENKTEHEVFITVTGWNKVGGFQHYIRYDHSKMICTKCESLIPEEITYQFLNNLDEPGLIFPMWVYKPIPGSEPGEGTTLPDHTAVMKLTFEKVDGGISDIWFDDAEEYSETPPIDRCLSADGFMQNMFDSPTARFYKNGSLEFKGSGTLPGNVPTVNQVPSDGTKLVDIDGIFT